MQYACYSAIRLLQCNTLSYFARSLVLIFNKMTQLWNNNNTYRCLEPFNVQLRSQGFSLLNWVRKKPWERYWPMYLALTAVKREKFEKNKKNTSKERLSLSLFKVL